MRTTSRPTPARDRMPAPSTRHLAACSRDLDELPYVIVLARYHAGALGVRAAPSTHRAPARGTYAIAVAPRSAPAFAPTTVAARDAARADTGDATTRTNADKRTRALDGKPPMASPALERHARPDLASPALERHARADLDEPPPALERHARPDLASPARERHVRPDLDEPPPALERHACADLASRARERHVRPDLDEPPPALERHARADLAEPPRALERHALATAIGGGRRVRAGTRALVLACVVLGGTAHAERPGGPGGPDPYERVACGGARAGADELGGQLGGQRDDDLRALGPDLEAGLDADLDADPREPGDAGERRDAGARAVLRLRGAPAIAEVLEAAYRASGLDGDPSRGWIRRARVSGLVPWVSVRTGWNASWREEDPDVGRSRAFEVRATWRLDRLLFDGRELQIASIEAARRRERRRLASYVIRAYFTWRRLAAAAMRSAARYGLAAAAAAAELDALTDGWFSDRAKSAR